MRCRAKTKRVPMMDNSKTWKQKKIKCKPLILPLVTREPASAWGISPLISQRKWQ